MGMEREIKLALPAQQIEAAHQWFAAQGGHAGEALTLENIYFDTPELALARARAAVRLRRTPNSWLQTYKTAGSAQNGLHSRHEWEMPVAGAALEVDALLRECDQPEAADALRRAAPALVEMFRTDFTRNLWLLHRDGAEIEAAIDLGEIVAKAGGEVRRMPIREIELELKRGEEAALHALSAELRQRITGLEPENASKAQRGYQLRA